MLKSNVIYNIQLNIERLNYIQQIICIFDKKRENLKSFWRSFPIHFVFALFHSLIYWPGYIFSCILGFKNITKFY